MARRIENKITLVTGGASGIGRATCLAFAREGAKVAVVDIDRAKGTETVERIEATGGDAVFIEADVSSEDAVEEMVLRTIETYGRLDCAFNNAGIVTSGRTHELSVAEWDRTIDVDLKGVFLCMKREIKQMLQQKGGAIVNTSSGAGLVGQAWTPAYSAAKHGVVGLTKSAALEYATEGIRINAVCPGIIRTGMTDRMLADPVKYDQAVGKEPMGRIGRPEEVAEAVVWLCSEAASFVTGHAMVVDGGFTV